MRDFGLYLGVFMGTLGGLWMASKYPPDVIIEIINKLLS